MTTKEKVRRKQAAKRQRIETPAVISLPSESDDLIEAAINPADALSEDNPGGVGEPIIDDAPLVGRSLTNEELIAKELIANSGEQLEFEPDPAEVWFAEKSLAVRNWFESVPAKLKAAHDAVINGWIAFGDFVSRQIDNLYKWAFETNNKFRDKMAELFPAKVTRNEMFELMSYMLDKLDNSQQAITEMIASKNTIDRGRLDSLLFAVQSKQKVRAVKLYASLTGTDLLTAKDAIGALA